MVDCCHLVENGECFWPQYAPNGFPFVLMGLAFFTLGPKSVKCKYSNGMISLKLAPLLMIPTLDGPGTPKMTSHFPTPLSVFTKLKVTFVDLVHFLKIAIFAKKCHGLFDCVKKATHRNDGLFRLEVVDCCLVDECFWPQYAPKGFISPCKYSNDDFFEIDTSVDNPYPRWPGNSKK